MTEILSPQIIIFIMHICPLFLDGMTFGLKMIQSEVQILCLNTFKCLMDSKNKEDQVMVPRKLQKYKSQI